jgi:hypothetical protein
MLPRGRRRRYGATGDHIHTRLGSGQILLSNVECVRELCPAWLRKLTAAHTTHAHTPCGAVVPRGRRLRSLKRAPRPRDRAPLHV